MWARTLMGECDAEVPGEGGRGQAPGWLRPSGAARVILALAPSG